MEQEKEQERGSLFGTFARMAALGAAAAFSYARWARPALLNWGATEEERADILPGDEFVSTPRYQSTHAISIDAPPEEVWPWLIQIGADRGGFYSYEWLENLAGLDIRNADQVIEAFQDLRVGDRISLANDDQFVMQAAIVDPPEALVLRSLDEHYESLTEGFPTSSWAFVLRAEAGPSCRLIVRTRMEFTPTPANLAFHHTMLEPAHFIMERKMLLSIRHRAERSWISRQIQSFAGDGSSGVAENSPN